MSEFLPVCDTLFNVISLAQYFCDVVFDVVLGYALYERGRYGYFIAVICLIIISLIVNNIVSFKWYLNNLKQQDEIKRQNNNGTTSTTTTTISLESTVTEQNFRHKRYSSNNPDTNLLLYHNENFQRYIIFIIHFIQLGVFWRYAKLFIPVNLRRVKHEIRDLCMLRLVHAFCEAAPMLLLQLYLLITIQNDSKFLLNTSELKLLKSLNGNSYTGSVIQHPIELQAEKTFKDLNLVSASLSLFSLCWALASFSKNVRLQNVHRLVLTWLGVIFQFLWRLGTVISRIAALTVYASFYKYWVFLVIILHWLSMFLWLISPKNVFHGEKISKIRKIICSGLIAFVYIFAYININLQEKNHRQKMAIFYVVMFLENSLLVCLWMVGVWNKPESNQWHLVFLIVFGSFGIGMIFMIFYYRFFHIRRLNHENGSPPSINGIKSNEKLDKNSLDSKTQPAGVFNCRFTNPVGSNATKRKKKKPTTFIPPPTIGFATNQQILKPSENLGPMTIPFWKRALPRSTTTSETEGSVCSKVNIHQKLQEKKQKQLAELKIIEEEIKQGKLGGGDNNRIGQNNTSLPRQPIPRTKKPPPEWCHQVDKRGNDIDELNNLNKFSNQYDPIYSSFGLCGVNIPAIEPSSSQSNSLTKQIPRTKLPPTQQQRYTAKQTTVSPVRSPPPPLVFDHMNHKNFFLEINHPRQISGTYSTSTVIGNQNTESFPYNVLPPPRSKIRNQIEQQQANIMMNKRHRAKTPEVLLTPHYYLDGTDTTAYYDAWAASSGDENLDVGGHDNNRNRCTSDIDSQISLPRSYTLPREFKYYRRGKGHPFIMSTNSSDGDVDSGDDNEKIPQHSKLPHQLNINGVPINTSIPINNNIQARRFKMNYNLNKYYCRHETKL